MDYLLRDFCIGIVTIPLVTSLITGFLGKRLGKSFVHWTTILGVLASFLLALRVLEILIWGGSLPLQVNLFTWASGHHVLPYAFYIGFLIDPLTAYMMVIVTFVSLLVHIYSVGYMAEDDGYHRFFSYISFFTFAMLLLVTSNNFLQLFVGWEGVGLASYLLIGFWYQKESALQGSLKAFLVNRVGDFGFLLGIGLILAYAGSLDYQEVISQAGSLSTQSITIAPFGECSLITVICILLFWGAMGKSAQIPLHVWLPESMEGPTPISALIHAATMVTAGVFMVARMSPLFEHSEAALSFILVIGASGAFFLGLIALVVHDIKRVVAYSTLSQLGYMMAALGTSSYSAGIFHLGTHACFKALLFLGAGSVILAMHHEQDIRNMGGLKRWMPITYGTFLIGSLALCAIPPFSGFYSKDVIIEAVKESQLWGSQYAYGCLLIGAFVTALYTFRLLFLVFHGKSRMDTETKLHLQESPWTVWLPLVILAIPSALMGIYLVEPLLFSAKPLLGQSLFVLPNHDVLKHLADHFHSPWEAVLHSVTSPTLWLSVGGIAVAWIVSVYKPSLSDGFVRRFQGLHRILIGKYGFDRFNDVFFIQGSRWLGEKIAQNSENKWIDKIMIDGTAQKIAQLAQKIRWIQTGYIFHYAAVMIVGALVLMLWMK